MFLKIIFAVGILLVIDGAIRLFLSISKNKFHQRLVFILLMYIISSSIFLCILYFWLYADRLPVMYLNIIIFIALLTIFSSIYFYLFLDKYVKNFFVTNMFNDLEKYSILHHIFKQYILNNEVELSFEDYNLDIKQAIELGIIIPIEKISYKDFKELGNIKIYIDEESIKVYQSQWDR